MLSATPARCKLLHAGVDTTVIALWLGHETTRGSSSSGAVFLRRMETAAFGR
jgi:hypothetical protein